MRIVENESSLCGESEQLYNWRSLNDSRQDKLRSAPPDRSILRKTTRHGGTFIGSQRGRKPILAQNIVVNFGIINCT